MRRILPAAVFVMATQAEAVTLKSKDHVRVEVTGDSFDGVFARFDYIGVIQRGTIRTWYSDSEFYINSPASPVALVPLTSPVWEGYVFNGRHEFSVVTPEGFSGTVNASFDDIGPYIPLPASVWMLLAALGGLGYASHRRKTTP